jgi:hypothetical protein
MDRLIKKKEQCFEKPSAFVPHRSVECFLIDLDRSILHDDTHGRPSSRTGGLKHLSLHCFVQPRRLSHAPPFGHFRAVQMCSQLPQKIIFYPAWAERAMPEGV